MVEHAPPHMHAHTHTHTHTLCSPKANFLQIRHQLLLNDYVSALLTVTGHTHCHTHPDTLAVVHSLVTSPLNNCRGHGPMVLLR